MLDTILSKRLQDIKEKNLYRTLRTMNTAPKTKMSIDGHDYLVFSSNNYLGLVSHPSVIKAAKDVLQSFGVGSTGSRLTTGNTDWHTKLEQRIATFKQVESALLFSNGYLANIGVLSSLPTEDDVIISDQLNHASLIDGCRLSKATTIVYDHINMDDLEKKLSNNMSYQNRYIVTDSVFSMDGTLAPLDKIIELANRYHAFVIVDDAHATGVLGKNGRGSSEHFGVTPHVVISTLSKAVGTEGGVVTGSKTLIDYLRNRARSFIFQTAIPPSICAASIVAIDLIEQDENRRKTMHENAQQIRTSLQQFGFTVMGDHSPIIPVIIGDASVAVQFAEKLQEKGIYAPAIRPPTVPVGKSRIRLTVTANHDQQEIKQLLAAFNEIGKEMKLIS